MKGRTASFGSNRSFDGAADGADGGGYLLFRADGFFWKKKLKKN